MGAAAAAAKVCHKVEPNRVELAKPGLFLLRRRRRRRRCRWNFIRQSRESWAMSVSCVESSCIFFGANRVVPGTTCIKIIAGPRQIVSGGNY